MTSLHALITALVRLLGLFYAIRTFDHAFSTLYWTAVQQTETADVPIAQSPMLLLILMILIYGGLSLAIFLLAPKLARLMIGPGDEGEKAEVSLQETLIFSIGVLLSSWAFVRVSDSVHGMFLGAQTSGGIYGFGPAMTVNLLPSFVLFAAGLLLVSKFNRISHWMQARRNGEHAS